MRAEFLGVALGKQLLIDLDEFGLGELARRTVDDEARVPHLDLLLRELGVLHQELQVGFRQLVLRPYTTHHTPFHSLSFISLSSLYNLFFFCISCLVVAVIVVVIVVVVFIYLSIYLSISPALVIVFVVASLRLDNLNCCLSCCCCLFVVYLIIITLAYTSHYIFFSR